VKGQGVKGHPLTLHFPFTHSPFTLHAFTLLLSMYLLKLIFRNSLRHKLRTALTTLGIVVAVLAFGLLQTLVVWRIRSA